MKDAHRIMKESKGVSRCNYKLSNVHVREAIESRPNQGGFCPGMVGINIRVYKVSWSVGSYADLLDQDLSLPQSFAFADREATQPPPATTSHIIDLENWVRVADPSPSALLALENSCIEGALLALPALIA